MRTRIGYTPHHVPLRARVAVSTTLWPRAAPTLNMNWHDPDLYLFLCKLAGLAALLAIAYELVRRRRKPPVILMEAKPLDGMPNSRQAGEQEAEQELARRAALLRSFLNVPARDRRNDDSPVYLKNVRPLTGLVRDPPLPSEEGQAAGNCERIEDVPPSDHFGNFAGARPVHSGSKR